MSIYRNDAAEANARLDRQRDLYRYGGGRHMDEIRAEITEIRKSVQETTALLNRLIELIQNNG